MNQKFQQEQNKSTTQNTLWRVLFSFSAALIFLIIGLVNLNQYGLTWDAPENLLTGEHYIQFFRTGDSQWLDFDTYNTIYRESKERPPLFNNQFNAPASFPPTANIIAVLTHELTTNHLGWLPDTDGYHVSVLLFAAITIMSLSFLMWQSYGAVAAITAVFTLTLYPLFYEHAHYNIKDIPFAAMVLLALLTFQQAIHTQKIKWLILSAIVTGLGMSIRILTIEVWLIIGFLYLVQKVSQTRQNHEKSTPFWWILVHVLLAVTIFLLSWPWLWEDPINRLQAHLDFGQNVSRGLRVLYNGEIWKSGKTLPWHYTAVLFLYTTPISILIAGLIGFIKSSQQAIRRQHPASTMLLLLFGGALLRTSWPDWPQYDGTRHMMDGIVAFTALAGIGMSAVWQWISPHIKSVRWQSTTAAGLFLLIFLPQFLTIKRLHPFTGIYYNQLAGGTTAVIDQQPQAYWGSSFRIGAEWLNHNLSPNATILPRVGGHLARYYLQPEFQVISDEALASMPEDQVVYVIYLFRRDKFDRIAQFVDENLTPMHIISRAGVPIIKIVQTDVRALQQSQ